MPSQEKSHVGMALCFFCLKEPAYILLDRRLTNTLPREAVYDFTPCRSCEEIMQQGVIFIGIDPASMAEVPEAEEAHKELVRRWETRYRHSVKRDGPPPFIPNPTRTGEWLAVTDDYVSRNIEPKKLANQILKLRWSFVDSAFAKGLLADYREQIGEPANSLEELRKRSSNPKSIDGS